jgi:hypothetical protein
MIATEGQRLEQHKPAQDRPGACQRSGAKLREPVHPALIHHMMQGLCAAIETDDLAYPLPAHQMVHHGALAFVAISQSHHKNRAGHIQPSLEGRV